MVVRSFLFAFLASSCAIGCDGKKDSDNGGEPGDTSTTTEVTKNLWYYGPNPCDPSPQTSVGECNPPGIYFRDNIKLNYTTSDLIESSAYTISGNKITIEALPNWDLEIIDGKTIRNNLNDEVFVLESEGG